MPRFIYIVVTDSIPSSHVGTSTGRRGLLNLGQTCFLNVVLQSFAHNPLLRNYFLGDKHNCKLCKLKDCTCCEMDKFFSEVGSNFSLVWTTLIWLLLLGLFGRHCSIWADHFPCHYLASFRWTFRLRATRRSWILYICIEPNSYHLQRLDECFL